MQKNMHFFVWVPEVGNPWWQTHTAPYVVGSSTHKNASRGICTHTSNKWNTLILKQKVCYLGLLYLGIKETQHWDVSVPWVCDVCSVRIWIWIWTFESSGKYFGSSLWYYLPKEVNQKWQEATSTFWTNTVLLKQFIIVASKHFLWTFVFCTTTHYFLFLWQYTKLPIHVIIAARPRGLKPTCAPWYNGGNGTLWPVVLNPAHLFHPGGISEKNIQFNTSKWSEGSFSKPSYRLTCLSSCITVATLIRVKVSCVCVQVEEELWRLFTFFMYSNILHYKNSW